MRIATQSAVLLATVLISLAAQERTVDSYVAPTDPLVLQNLDRWQDLKFGLFMHWGPYSQWGVVESWSICPEDEGWTKRRGPYSADYFEYKKRYEELPKTFNPVQFRPEKWVAAAKYAGMKYVVFTTKHHDGFCMFDTRQTSYRITDPKTPFPTHPRSNVAREIFDAFRKEGFLVGAYFSKPDWHSEFYWWPYFPPKDRNVNYDPAKYPERWAAFKQFTFDQIEELMTGYGRIDILWLDGGWVRPRRQEPGRAGRVFDQDVEMPKIAAMARGHQPGLIVVDRSVSGPFENYTTPEQQIPDRPLSHPWETCMTMGRSWSYVPNDRYKSPREIVRNLIEIVAKGGNYLLNIGPGPEGDWDPVAYDRLEAVGRWIETAGEGIYGTRPVAPYARGPIRLTRSKRDDTVYAFLLSDEEQVRLPAEVEIPATSSNPVRSIGLLAPRRELRWREQDGNLRVEIPADVKSDESLRYAAVFAIRY